MNSRFSFVGTVDANSLESKVPFYRNIATDNATGIGLNLVVIAATNNRAFVETVGFVNSVIKTYDPNGKELNIKWDMRFDEKEIEKVANYKKNVITLNGNRHEFISEYDFVKFVIDNIDEIKGKKFTVTGQIKKNVYKRKISDKFIVQNLFEVKDDEEKKNQLRVMTEFFYNSEGIDTSDWKKEKKLRINGYTKEYIDADHKAVYVDRQIIFDCSKVDWDNDLHLKKVKFKLAQLKLDFEDGKIITSNLKKGKYYSLTVVLNYMNGSPEIEFSENELTDNQKLAISLGMKTLDDFRPKGNIYGDRVVEFKLVDFNLRDDFANGAKEVESSKAQFEDNIYIIPSESLEDFENTLNEPTEIDEDDIFG